MELPLKIKVFAALALFACLPLLGQVTPRPIDFTQVLVGINGQPMMAGDVKSPTPLTLGDAAVNALLSPTQADQQMTGIEKFKLDELARKIYGKKDVVLTLDELKLIKDRVGSISPPMVVGAVWRLLDPAQK
jgi:hypothetical protein